MQLSKQTNHITSPHKKTAFKRDFGPREVPRLENLHFHFHAWLIWQLTKWDGTSRYQHFPRYLPLPPQKVRRAHSVLFGSRKGKSSNQLLFCHNNKVKLILESRLILKSRPPDFSPGLSRVYLGLDLNLGAWTQGSAWTLGSAWLCCCSRKVADLKIYLFFCYQTRQSGP